MSEPGQAALVKSWLLRAPWEDDRRYRGVATRSNEEPFAWEAWFEEGRGTPGAVAELIEILEAETNLEQPSVITGRAAYALGWIGDDSAIGSLTRLLDTKWPPLRSEVIAALGRLRASTHFERFRDYALDEHEDQDVRGNAIIALGKLCHPRSAEVLEQIETGSTFLARCVQAGLGLLGDRRQDGSGGGACHAASGSQ